MKDDKIYRIMILFHHCDKNNGGVGSMLDLIDVLQKEDNIILYAVFPEKNGTAQDYLKSKDIECKYVPFLRWDYNINQDFVHRAWETRKIFNIYYNCILANQLKSYIESKRINIIYTNTITVNFGCILSKKYHIPHIWHFREFGWEDHQLKCIYGKKIAYEWMRKYSDKVIAISQSLKNKYEKYISGERINVIYDDVSSKYIQTKDEKQFLEHKVKLLIAGTLQEGKGQVEAVKATKILLNKGYEVELYIAGTGQIEYANKLKKLINQSSLGKNIFLLGQVTDMNSLRQDKQIALVCSKCEAFGRVTVEAMLSGMLVIGADAAGTSELITNENTGFLYRPGDENDLSKKIEYAIQHRKLMKQIAYKGQEFAINRFTKGKCAEQVYSLIKQTYNRN